MLDPGILLTADLNSLPTCNKWPVRRVIVERRDGGPQVARPILMKQLLAPFGQDLLSDFLPE